MARKRSTAKKDEETTWTPPDGWIVDDPSAEQVTATKDYEDGRRRTIFAESTEQFDELAKQYDDGL